jgi:hypothetical protein
VELTYEMIEASIFDELGAEVAALGALLEALREREGEWLTRQELLAAVQANRELMTTVQTRQPHLTRHALNIALQRLKDVPGVESKLALSPLYRWLP